MPAQAQKAIWAAFDGEEVGDAGAFFAEIARAGGMLGYPCFLRTGHTSGKHDWKNTCFLPDEPSIPQHVFNIVEYGELQNIVGSPIDIWAVREMLPTRPVAACPRFGDMPVCREFRLFVEGVTVQCVHPYWPRQALDQGGCPWTFDYDAFCRLNAEAEGELRRIAGAAGEACEGAWSVDILETGRGWVLIDMAEAHKSFHWEGCTHDQSRG